ncbi:MAG: phosphoglucosamine mutase [Actinomycetota bacterium]|nr:phosphoglucosamine mutase [Actinomycetota bacterium]
MARLFGTDGVRGVANRDLTPELAFSLGRAAVQALAGGDRPRIVIGRDTRVSGPMLQAALSSGICSAGGDVIRLGVVPTPAVAFVTARLGAAAGAVISASHNPPPDNGIKFFSSDGRKLPDEVEDRIEGLVAEAGGPRPEGSDVGTVADAPGEVQGYLEHVLGAAEAPLGSMHVVVDCGYGAASGLAPEALQRLGARVDAINDEPIGERINVDCGATRPDVVAQAVKAIGADAGVAFDGDADRALFADAEGNVIDGDQVIAACALSLKRQGRLPRDTVVVTVMANLGLRRSLEGAGITVLETQVGDRYVLEEMLRSGAGLGGEQSGHVVFLDQATTGDGLLTAVRFLSLAAADGVGVADLAGAMRRYPQVLENVRVEAPAAAVSGSAVSEAVLRAERALGGSGRILVRPSGTEPVVRVMVEAEAEEDARRHAADVAAAVRAASG